MSYPNLVKSELQDSITKALATSDFASSLKKTRDRKLSHAEVIRALMVMQGGSLKKELLEAGLSITPSAFVQRRYQLEPNAIGDALSDFYGKCKAPERFNGYRVLAIDGTAINMFRDPKSACFMCNASAPRGYCQMHANPLYDVLNKHYVDCVIQPQPAQDEIGALLFMLAWRDFPSKTLIVADRAYSSYNLFATIQAMPNVDFLIRIKQGKGAMREVAKLPMEELDREIGFTITTTQTKEDKAKGHIFLQTQKEEPERPYSAKTRKGRWNFPSPYPMKLRIVRIMLDTGEYETLATSLPPSFTPEQMKQLYHARWGIETAFRELKYNYGLVNLHGKSEQFVRQEIYAAMLMASACSRIIKKVVIQQHKGNTYLYQVDQKMAVYLCKKFFRTPGADGEKLMEDIAKFTEPVRPGRQGQRNLRVKGFPGFVYRIAA